MKMKKLTSFFVLLVAILAMCFAANAADYTYGYYLESAEYVDDNVVEATIMLTSSYGSTADVDTNLILAIYDDVGNKLLNTVNTKLEYEKPFADKQRFSVTQQITLEDTTLERYRVAAYLWDDNSITPSAEMDKFNNIAILTQEDLAVKDRVTIVAKVPQISLDSANDYIDLSSIAIIDGDPSIWQYVNFGSIKKGNVDFKDFLGLAVDVVVDVSDIYNPVALSAKISDSNNFLEIDYKLFSGISAYGSFEYYENQDSVKMTTSRIETPFNIYSNLMYIGSYQDGDYDGVIDNFDYLTGTVFNLAAEPNNTLYKFVDTDNNGYYDTVLIENKASFVVDRVSASSYSMSASNASGYVFNSKVAYAAAGTNYTYTLVLDPDDEYISYSMKDINGNELTINDISVGDVVTYSLSVDGGYIYYDITVSRNVVTGSISKIRTKTIHGIAYTYFKINDNEYLINNTNYIYILELGSSGSFTITPDGKIITANLDFKYSFGVVLKIADVGTSLSEDMQARMMIDDGSIKDISFADTYYIDGYKYAGTLPTTGTYSLDLDELNVNTSGQFVMYQLDDNGEIKYLYTTNYMVDIETNGRYSLIPLSAMQYDEAKGVLGSGYLTDSSKIFASGVYVTPDVTASDPKDWVLCDDADDYSEISVSVLEDGMVYYITTIVDENDDIVYALLHDFIALPKYSSAPMYITDIGYVMVDGIIAKEITGYVNGEEVSYVISDEAVALKMGGTSTADIIYWDGEQIGSIGIDIEVGDVIQFVADTDGKITIYRHLVKVHNNTAYMLVTDNLTSVDPDNANISLSANLVGYSLSGGTVPTIGDVDFIPTATATTTSYGYGVAGRVHSIRSRNINLYADYDTLYVHDYDSGVVSVMFDDTLPLYKTSSNYRYGVSLGSVSAMTTFKDGVGATNAEQLASADDVLYIFSYDGEPILQYSIDLARNNR